MLEHGRFEVAKNLGEKDCVINVKLLRGKTTTTMTPIYILAQNPL
jgi:hypothetical protein